MSLDNDKIMKEKTEFKIKIGKDEYDLTKFYHKLEDKEFGKFLGEFIRERAGKKRKYELSEKFKEEIESSYNKYKA